MKTCPVCSYNNTDGAIRCVNCKSLLDGSGGVEKTRLADPADFTVETGDVIDGRYKVVRLLGEGGMGEVYLALDLLMDEEQCALKLIHYTLMQSPEARHRFRSEVATSRGLHHPAIVRVYDMGKWKEHEQYYFTMEYIKGKTLAALLHEKKGTIPPFSLEETGRIMAPILQCLAYAHEHTIHRDIKPDNIMVEGEFPEVKIKILDFGIARAMSASRFTRTAQGLGTPHYMAPEQMEDAHNIDHRADLYGVGMILYELLTGKRAMGRFKPLVQVIGPAYAPMDPVVDTALAPDPEDRYRDASAMLTDVEKALARIGSNLEAEEAQPSTPENPAQKPEPTPKTESSQESKKKNPLPIFAGLTALLLVAGFAYFFLHGGGGKSDPTVEKPASPAHIEQPAVDPRAEQLAECEQHRINRAWQQAETCYRAVLEKFPDEQQAKAGLDTIYQQIVAAGRRAVEQGDLNTARKQLALLESFAGAGDRAKTLQKQIGDYEKQQEIAAQKEKEEKRKKEIAGQLARCGELHNNNEFAKAYSCYTDVLQRDSNNQQARTGVEGIIRDVLNTGSRAVGKGDLNTARKQLALLQSFAGAGDSAKTLQKQINDYEKQQKIAAQKEKERRRKQRQEAQLKAKNAELKQQIGAAEQAENWQEMLTLAQALLELNPRNSLANDALSFARRKIAEEKEKASLARLTITPKPADARIRILNIAPPYEPGMQLKPGRYHIEVSAKGYKTKTQWIELDKQEEQELVVSLEKTPQKETFFPAGPLLGPTYTDPTTGMEFVYVKGGCYHMGNSFSDGEGDADEKPVHDVCVDSFYMGKYEVRQKEYKKIMGLNPSKNKGSFFRSKDNYPVENVSWNDAQQFIRKLNTKSHRKYRLPTEAEWEYAARSGGKKEKYAGSDVPGDVSVSNAFYTNNGPKHTINVGSKKSNGLGIYDMSGNVWEWCSDWHDNNYYEISPHNNPQGPSSGSDRVVRGGSWADFGRGIRTVNRGMDEPSARSGTYGFRLVLSQNNKE